MPSRHSILIALLFTSYNILTYMYASKQVNLYIMCVIFWQSHLKTVQLSVSWTAVIELFKISGSCPVWSGGIYCSQISMWGQVGL